MSSQVAFKVPDLQRCGSQSGFTVSDSWQCKGVQCTKMHSLPAEVQHAYALPTAKLDCLPRKDMAANQGGFAVGAAWQDLDEQYTKINKSPI